MFLITLISTLTDGLSVDVKGLNELTLEDFEAFLFYSCSFGYFTSKLKYKVIKNWQLERNTFGNSTWSGDETDWDLSKCPCGGQDICPGVSGSEPPQNQVCTLLQQSTSRTQYCAVTVKIHRVDERGQLIRGFMISRTHLVQTGNSLRLTRYTIWTGPMGEERACAQHHFTTVQTLSEDLSGPESNSQEHHDSLLLQRSDNICPDNTEDAHRHRHRDADTPTERHTHRHTNTNTCRLAIFAGTLHWLQFLSIA